jgi:hypothetical protein
LATLPQAAAGPAIRFLRVSGRTRVVVDVMPGGQH